MNVAWPLPLRLDVPSSVPAPQVPSLSVMLPAGVPTPGETTVTLAVNVTLWLNTDGFRPELTEAVVPALFTF